LIISEIFKKISINQKDMGKKKGLTDGKPAEEDAKKALLDRKDRFRELLENLSEGIVILDKKNMITYANDRFLEMLGYRKEEVTGRPITALLGKGWLRKDAQEKSEEDKDQWKSSEIAWQRKDGQTVYTILSPRPIHDNKGQFRGTIAVLTDITDRRKVEIELRRSHEELRTLSQHIQSVREMESKRIAGEIHDVLGQQLTALKIDLSWLAERVRSGDPKSDSLLKKIGAMSELVDQTIQAVQKISAELRPRLLDDLGLFPAIEWLSQDFEKRTKIRCRLRVDREDVSLSPDLATAIFRISQEALTNVARHANATRVNIHFKMEDGALVLLIKDNGKGIKEERVWDPSSLGIMGMRERVRRFKGDLSIFGSPQRGTTLKAIFPKLKD